MRALKALYTSSAFFVTPSARWGLGSGSGFAEVKTQDTPVSATGVAGGLALRDAEMLDRRRSSLNNLRARFDGSQAGSPVSAGGPSATGKSHSGAQSGSLPGSLDDGTLRVLIRAAIGKLYEPDHLRLVLSCLFLSRIFDKEYEDACYVEPAHGRTGAASRSHSRNPSISEQTAPMLSKTPSSMSLGGPTRSARLQPGSGHATPVATSHPPSPVIGAVPGLRSILTHMDQARLSSIAEIVCIILSNTLGTPSGPADAHTSVAPVFSHSTEPATRPRSDASKAAPSPVVEIGARRSSILDFVDDCDSSFRRHLASRGASRADTKGKARQRDADVQMDEGADPADPADQEDQERRGRPDEPALARWYRAAEPSHATLLRSKSRKRGREEEGTVLERLILFTENGHGRVRFVDNGEDER